MITSILLAVVLANQWVGFQAADDLILRSVAIVHRHGDRTPLSTFPTDPYANISIWPDGWGELTNAGKVRMFTLGGYLSRRYGDFWPQSIREVHVRSSDADRCLESAALVLAGAFPPKGRWAWSEGLKWVPFPIHTEPRSIDGMLNPASFCPNSEREEERIRASPEYLRYQEEFKDLFAFLSQRTGLNITDLISAQRVYDTLKIQKENNFTLPSWVDDKLMSRLVRVSDLTFYLDYSTPLIQRLRAGEFLKDLKNRFTDIIREPIKNNGKDGSPTLTEIKKKIFFYSTHDSQLAILLSALQVFDKLSPPYGSSVLFELYQVSRSNQFKLSLLYLNDTYKEAPHYLQLPVCDDLQSCDIDTFFKFIADRIPDNWRNECGLEVSQCEEDLLTISLNLLAFIAVSIMVSFILIHLALKKRGRDAYVYQMLPVL